MSNITISRQPLVNRQSKIIATRLSLHFNDGATTKEAAQALNALAEFWPQGEKLVFINCGNTLCNSALLEWEIPENATLEIQPAALLGNTAADFIAAIRAKSPSLCLVFNSVNTRR